MLFAVDDAQETKKTTKFNRIQQQGAVAYGLFNQKLHLNYQLKRRVGKRVGNASCRRQ